MANHSGFSGFIQGVSNPQGGFNQASLFSGNPNQATPSFGPSPSPNNPGVGFMQNPASNSLFPTASNTSGPSLFGGGFSTNSSNPTVGFSGNASNQVGVFSGNPSNPTGGFPKSVSNPPSGFSGNNLIPTGGFLANSPNITGGFSAGGSNSGSTSLFNTNSTSAPPSTGLFSNSTPAPSNPGLFSNQISAPSNPGLFSNSAPAPLNAGSFSNQTSAPLNTGLFTSSAPPPSSSGLFSSSISSGGHFSNTAAPVNTMLPNPNNSNNPSNTSLFSAPPVLNSSLPGGPPSTSGPTNLFGANSGTNAPGGLTASNNAPSPTGLGLFKSNSTASNTSNPAPSVNQGGSTSSFFGGNTSGGPTSLFGPTTGSLMPASTGTLLGAKTTQPSPLATQSTPLQSSSLFATSASSTNNLTQPKLPQPNPSAAISSSSPTKIDGLPQQNPLLSNTNPLEAGPKTIQDNIKNLIIKQRVDRNLKESKNELEKQFYKFKELSQNTIELEADNYCIQNDMIKLNESINNMKKSQQEINDELSMIEDEQESYNGLLETIDRELNTKCQYLYRYNQENTIYDKTADISCCIGSLEQGLKEIVKKLNENPDESDCYTIEIENSLDALLDSLNWIESKIVKFI